MEVTPRRHTFDKKSIVAAVLLGSLSACDSCNELDPDEKTWWCSELTVEADGQQLDNSYEACTCATSQPADSVFENQCLEDWLAGNELTCEVNGPPTNSGSCPGTDTDGPYDGTGGFPGDDCTNRGPDGECCDPTVVTDCCSSGLACPNYDYENLPFTGLTPTSPYRASVSGSTLELVFAEGTADEDSDTVTLTGTLDYALTNCGETWCPFFLNGIDVRAPSSLVLDIKKNNKTKTKTLSNLEFKLLYPIAGTHRVGEVLSGYFSKYGMVLSVEFDLSGPEFSNENGHYSIVSTNTEDVQTGNNVSGHTFTFDGLGQALDLSSYAGIDLTATISQSVTLTDEPPSVSADVNVDSCMSCGAADVDFNATATDPDNDIQVKIWWVDGMVAHIGEDFSMQLSNGSHTWEFGAFDGRNAFQSVGGTVTVSCVC